MICFMSKLAEIFASTDANAFVLKQSQAIYLIHNASYFRAPIGRQVVNQLFVSTIFSAHSNRLRHSGVSGLNAGAEASAFHAAVQQPERRRNP
jgi:hypothetical protein